MSWLMKRSTTASPWERIRGGYYGDSPIEALLAAPRTLALLLMAVVCERCQDQVSSGIRDARRSISLVDTGTL
jgi:hypothetical protein